MNNYWGLTWGEIVEDIKEEEEIDIEEWGG